MLAYPCIITQLCLAAAVQDLPSINELIEATSITNLELIRDAGYPLARQERRTADMVKDMFR